MSQASIVRLHNDALDGATAMRLISDVAAATILDPDLNRALVARPHCVSAIAMQVAYVVRHATYCKSAALSRVAASSAAPVPELPNAATPLQANVTVIGLGNVGTAVVDRLLSKNVTHPTAITVVTRQTTFPRRFSDIGVRCFNDVAECISSADVVVICCQPGQFQAAAKGIKDCGGLKGAAVVVSTCASISADKIAAELSHPSCMTSMIDVAAISLLADSWSKEDETLAKQRRLEFAASKTMFSANVPQSADTLDLTRESADARGARRVAEMRDAAFFVDAVEACCRVVYTLAVGQTHRGLVPEVAFALSVESVLGWRVQATDDDLQTKCTVIGISRAANVAERDVLEKFHESFRHSL